MWHRRAQERERKCNMKNEAEYLKSFELFTVFMNQTNIKAQLGELHNGYLYSKDLDSKEREADAL
jgi:hypothetical protein